MLSQPPLAPAVDSHVMPLELSMEALSASLNAMFGSMPPTIRTIWSVFALLMVIAVLVAVLYERRRYAAHNKAGGSGHLAFNR